MFTFSLLADRRRVDRRDTIASRSSVPAIFIAARARREEKGMKGEERKLEEVRE